MRVAKNAGKLERKKSKGRSFRSDKKNVKKGGLGYSDIPLTPNIHTSQTQPEQRKV